MKENPCKKTIFFPFKNQFEHNMPNINPFISLGIAACSLTYNAILYSKIVKKKYTKKKKKSKSTHLISFFLFYIAGLVKLDKIEIKMKKEMV